MRICMIFPKTTLFENPMVYPPLGLFSLKAVLQDKGHKVDYFDMSEPALDGTLKRENPPDGDYDLYMISGTSPQAKEIISLGQYIKTVFKKPIIVGGPHVTNNAGNPTSYSDLEKDSSLAIIDPVKERSRERLLKTFNVLVAYEGETAVLEAVERIGEGVRAMERFDRGIVMRHPLIAQEGMGIIPPPDREYGDLYDAKLVDQAGNVYKTTTMFSARGCPERCSFCDSPALWGRGMRYAPMYRVQEELDDIYQRGFRGIYFYDDILFLHKQRAMELYERMAKYGFVSRGNVRTDIICHKNYGYEFLKYMADHGLVDIFVGVESGSNEMKNNIHKGTTIEQDTQVLKWCKELGIKYKASVIFGLPGETRESMEATSRWVFENRPDKVNACLFIPFAGIPIVKGVNIALGIETPDDRAKKYGSDAIHDYDIRWDLAPEDLESYFYAGSRTPGAMRALVHTEALAAQEIQDHFDEFLRKLSIEGIPY